MLKNLYDLHSIRSDNYRKLDEDIVQQLVTSILEVGLQEPIHLFQINETGDLYVISGHHRLEAMRRVRDNPRNPGMVFQAHVTRGSQAEYLSQETAIKAVMANSFRQDMKIVDKAAAVHKLVQVGLDIDEIAKIVHMEEHHIQKLLSVAMLPDEVKEFIYENPRLRDSIIVKFAMRLEQDADFPIMDAFSDILGRPMRRQGAQAQQPKLDRKAIREKLVATGDFNPGQIDVILDCIEA